MYLDQSNDIYYLGVYQPYNIYDEYGDKIRNPLFNKETGGYILDVKQNKDLGVNYYSSKLINEFSQVQNLKKLNISITCVPSHTKGNLSEGLLRIIKKLSCEFGFYDYAGILERTFHIQKLSSGGDRSIENHLRTIKVVNEDLVKNKNIIILDDVTTTGNSLIACKRILRSAGANQVVCLALGKTVECFN